MNTHHTLKIYRRWSGVYDVVKANIKLCVCGNNIPNFRQVFCSPTKAILLIVINN